jgi:hypothetical protein
MKDIPRVKRELETRQKAYQSGNGDAVELQWSGETVGEHKIGMGSGNPSDR